MKTNLSRIPGKSDAPSPRPSPPRRGRTPGRAHATAGFSLSPSEGEGAGATGPGGGDVSRRKFLQSGAAAAAAFTIVPRHVLGGPGYVAPSEKITLAHIGCGTQGFRELSALLSMPEVQIVAVCDPVREGYDYVDWSKDGLRAEVAKFLGKPEWKRDAPGIPGGREVMKEVVETFYASKRSAGKFKGCASYADFRELLDK